MRAHAASVFPHISPIKVCTGVNWTHEGALVPTPTPGPAPGHVGLASLQLERFQSHPKLQFLVEGVGFPSKRSHLGVKQIKESKPKKGKNGALL